MRPLSYIEKLIIQRIAEKLDLELRNQLIFDMQHAQVESQNEQNSRIIFHIEGYERPSCQGQHGYPVEGTVQDIDGIEVAVWLYADQNDRLLELEFCRWDDKKTSMLINPDWNTLKIF